jgi:hypothetical protein
MPIKHGLHRDEIENDSSGLILHEKDRDANELVGFFVERVNEASRYCLT